MGKFTDPAYFLIDHYINTINIETSVDIKSNIVELWPVIFTNWDAVQFKDYNNIDWAFEYDTIEGSYSKNQAAYTYQESYLIGQNKCIIAKGDRIVELFVKDEDFGYRQIYVTPPSNYKDENFFNFHKHITLQFQYGSTLTEEISGARFHFKVYSPTVQFDPDDINGKEVYFRKDSLFHDWLINYAESYFSDLWNENFIIRNYVNTDKLFMYFGRIYHKYSDEYHIEFYGMKDFINMSVPYHQLTPNLKEFLNVEFDRVYHEVHNLTKNIWSLIDPYEVDEKFLGYIAKFYNINVDNQSIRILNQREFIRELTYYLKRKGSYNSFYSSWKVLTQGTNNTLNIYDKWLDKSLSSTSSIIDPDDLKVVNYTEQYSTDSFDPDDYIITPYYKIQMDISTEPMEYYKILPSNVINSLLYQWEELRPVNKVSEYEILLEIDVDLTGNIHALYKGDLERYNTNVLSHVQKFSVAVTGAYIQIFGGEYTSFLINHNLNSNHLFIRCYDMNFTEIVPLSVVFIDGDNIRVTFSEPLNGFVLVRLPDQTILQLSDLSVPWRIKHPFTQKELYIEFNKLDEKLYIDELLLIDDDEFESNLKSGATNISKPDLVYIQPVDNTVWNIEHGLGYKGVLVSCFDINNNEIVPKEVVFVDLDTCTVTFEEPTRGYAALLSVGSPLFADMLIVDGELPFYEANSTLNNTGVYDYKSRVSDYYETDDLLYLIIDIPTGIELTIREIRVYDSNNNVLLYTECGEIFKPMNVKMKVQYKISKYTTKGSL